MGDAFEDGRLEPPRLDDVYSRVVVICRKAGIRFGLRDDGLEIDFTEIDWAIWPPMRRRLECLGGAKLVRVIEDQDGFKAAKRLHKADTVARIEARRSKALLDAAARTRTLL